MLGNIFSKIFKSEMQDSGQLTRWLAEEIEMAKIVKNINGKYAGYESVIWFTTQKSHAEIKCALSVLGAIL